jgi:hypothetical protein
MLRIEPARHVIAVSLLGRDACAEAPGRSLEVEQALVWIAANRHELPPVHAKLR